jgi:hypothetical protein
MGVDSAIASINQSIEQGWTGLFEPKGIAHGRNNRKSGQFSEQLDISAVTV